MNIILQQLGGNKFIAMTGAKDFVSNGDKRLDMRLPRNMSKANRLSISLDESDNYKMIFSNYTPCKLNTKTFKWTETKHEIIETFEGLFDIDLQKIFTEVTGMDTRL